MKYLIVTATAVMAGTSYVLFTFQAVIVFVIPSIIAGFYMNKRLLYSGFFFLIFLMVDRYMQLIKEILQRRLPTYK